MIFYTIMWVVMVFFKKKILILRKLSLNLQSIYFYVEFNITLFIRKGVELYSRNIIYKI